MHTGSCLGDSVFQQVFLDFVVKCHLKFHCRNINIYIYTSSTAEGGGGSFKHKQLYEM